MLLFILVSAVLFAIPGGAIWPLPQHYRSGASVVWISPSITFSLTLAPENTDQCYIYHEIQLLLRQTPPICPREQGSGVLSTQTHVFVHSAFAWFKGTLLAKLLVPVNLRPRDFPFEPSLGERRAPANLIEIEIRDDFRELSQSPELYKLLVQEDGGISILAASSVGVQHALITLSQLFYFHSLSHQAYTPYAPLVISDWPRFQHRGLNLDIARNEITADDVIRTLDAMSFNKLNRLHLHAADSQSWPLEIPTLPKLAHHGAYRIGQVWSAADLRRVQEHGHTRGIEVYLEIDMPGHTSSIFHSFPSLIVAYDQPLTNYSASEPPSGQLSLNDTRVSDFVGTLLVDILQRSSPYTSLFHLGGDELNTKVYELDPTINSSSKDVIQPLLQKFYHHALSFVKNFSVEPVFWEEAVLEWDVDLPRNTIIQVWRSPEALEAVVARGFRALFGSASHWYLDCGYGSFLDPSQSEDQESAKPPYLDWCSPYKNWRQIYAYDPLAKIAEDSISLVIGGEVHLWTELTDSISLDGKLWPRAAAAAEILWKGPGTVTESVTSRLAEMRERLVKQGIQASMVQMQWCLMNPGQCIQ